MYHLINRDILRLLGIDSHGITKATIELDPGRPPVVTLERQVHRLGIPGPELVTRKFDLVPRFEEAPKAPKVEVGDRIVARGREFTVTDVGTVLSPGSRQIGPKLDDLPVASVDAATVFRRWSRGVPFYESSKPPLPDAKAAKGDDSGVLSTAEHMAGRLAEALQRAEGRQTTITDRFVLNAPTSARANREG